MKKGKILISMLIIFVLLFPYMNTALAVYENTMENVNTENITDEKSTENIVDNSENNVSNSVENKFENEIENKNEINEIANNTIENDTVVINTIVENEIDNTTLENSEESNKVDNEKINNEDVLEKEEVDKEELQEAKKGIMCLDTVQNNPTYYIPTDKVLDVSGWAVSNDEKATVRVYINGMYWIAEMDRISRPDVDAISGEYGGTEKTKNAGFSNKIDISSFPVGNYTLRVEQVSGEGEILSYVERPFTIKKETVRGTMCLDTVQNNPTYYIPTDKVLDISGWAVSNDEKATVRVYINGMYWIAEMDRISRPDVDAISGEYGGTEKTKNAGFSNKIDISSFPVGNYTLRVEQVSVDGEILSYVERPFTIKKDAIRGTMCLDTVQNNPTYYIPTNKEIDVSGWAVSNDEKATIRVYINGMYWIAEMDRISRPDVDAISGEYGGTEKTKNAGFSNKIDISSFPVGNYTLRVEQVSGEGEVLSYVERPFTIKQTEYKGIMTIDTVPNGQKYEVPNTEKLRVAGWAVSNDPKVKIKLYINGACWIENMTRVARPDIDKIAEEYGGKTENAGFDNTIEIVNLPEGTHLITVEQVSSTGKVLSRSDTNIVIKREDFRGIVFIDSPINTQLYNKTNNILRISGWALSTDAKDSIQIKINNTIQPVIRYERTDVDAEEYGGAEKNKQAGFVCEIDVSNYPEAVYNLEVSVVSRWGEIISSSSRNFEVSFSRYAGVDVSRHNGKVDWKRLKDQGIEFAILRIGYGQNDNQKDETFEYNYEECKKYGIKVGIYLYSYAMSIEDSAKEAANCLNWLQGRSLDLPIYYDIENQTAGYPQHTLSRDTLTNMALTFLNQVSTAGYKGGLYSSKSWLESKFDMSRIENTYSVWVAHYTSLVQTTYKGKYDIWQWTNGENDTILGGFDRNWCYRKSLME